MHIYMTKLLSSFIIQLVYSPTDTRVIHEHKFVKVRFTKVF